MAKKTHTTRASQTLGERVRSEVDTLTQRVRGSVETQLGDLEERARKNPTLENLRKTASSVKTRVEKRAAELHTSAVRRVGLATTADLDKLTKKLNSLTRKITRRDVAA